MIDLLLINVRDKLGRYFHPSVTSPKARNAKRRNDSSGHFPG